MSIRMKKCTCPPSNRAESFVCPDCGGRIGSPPPKSDVFQMARELVSSFYERHGIEYDEENEHRNVDYQTAVGTLMLADRIAQRK